MTKKAHTSRSRLTFVKQVEFGKRPAALYRCECGVEKTIRMDGVKSGVVKSCGCYNKELFMKMAVTHGLSYHPIYRTYKYMIRRCYDKKYKRYHDYGGRGVVVCKKWRNSFKAFYNWCIENNWQPGLQLDKDKKGNGYMYSPRWCSILTPKENMKYRRNSIFYDFFGQKLQLYEISKITGIPIPTLYARVNTHKWDIEKAVTTPGIKTSKWKPYVIKK